MATCDCNNVTLGNSGRPDCTLIANVTNNLIVVPTFDSAGAKNYIDTTVTLDSAYFAALINNTDTTLRYYPLPAMKNVTDVRDVPITESFPDGSEVVLSSGARKFSGEWIGKDSSFVFLGKVENYGCGDISAFIVDIDGNIIGNGEDADKLYPIKLDGDTWFTNLVSAVAGSSIQKIMLTYNYDRSEEDSNLRMITASETSVDMRDLKGLIDVNAGAASGISTTTFTTALTFDYGSQVTKKAFEGAVLADFVLAETSPTPGTVTITTVTESSAGVYDFVFPAETSADVLSLTLSKNGFEMTALTVTIP